MLSREGVRDGGGIFSSVARCRSWPCRRKRITFYLIFYNTILFWIIFIENEIWRGFWWYKTL